MCGIALSRVLLQGFASTATGKRSTWHTKPRVRVSLSASATRTYVNRCWSLTRSPRSPARTVWASQHEPPRRSALERREVDRGVVCPSGRTCCHVGTAVSHQCHNVYALSPGICLLYLSSGRPNSLAGEWAMGEGNWTSSRAGAYRQGHLCWVDENGLQVEGTGRRVCAPRRGPDQTPSTSEVLEAREGMMRGRSLSSWV